MLPTMPRSITTTADRQKAQRLKALWLSLKDDLQLTQLAAARALGIKQPTLSQYLNGVIPLNTDAIFKFAELLHVDPWDIDPGLQKIQTLRKVTDNKAVNRYLPVIGSLSGRSILDYPTLLASGIPYEGIYTCVLIDNQELVSLGLPKHSALVLDMTSDPYALDSDVAVRIRGEDGFRYLTVRGQNQTSLRFSDPVTQETRTYRLSQLAQMHRVFSTVLPCEA